MAAPQQSPNQDNSSGILWVIFGIFAAAGLIWYAFKNYIIYGFLVFKLYEAKLLSFVSPSYFDPIQTNILLAMKHAGQLSFNDLLTVAEHVGNVIHIPFAIFLFLLAVLVYFGHTARVYKKSYDMKSLAKLEKENWPQISPIVDLDLLKVDIDKGPWAMSMTPMQFCKHYKLLEEIRPQRKEGMTRKEWDKIEVVLKRGNANRIFALQLGPVWRGINKLPPHTRALFAAFAARINADSAPAADLLKQLSASPKGKLNMSGVDALIKKHEGTKRVQQIIQSHAYVKTVMASMLEAAREDGVQASADFLWLKPMDRKLWYILNTVGRQTPFVEIAGIFAQWVAEKEAGRKLNVPIIEEATKALDLALKEVVYHPDET